MNIIHNRNTMKSSLEDDLWVALYTVITEPATARQIQALWYTDIDKENFNKERRFQIVKNAGRLYSKKNSPEPKNPRTFNSPITGGTFYTKSSKLDKFFSKGKKQAADFYNCSENRFSNKSKPFALNPEKLRNNYDGLPGTYLKLLDISEFRNLFPTQRIYYLFHGDKELVRRHGKEFFKDISQLLVEPGSPYREAGLYLKNPLKGRNQTEDFEEGIIEGTENRILFELQGFYQKWQDILDDGYLKEIIVRLNRFGFDHCDLLFDLQGDRISKLATDIDDALESDINEYVDDLDSKKMRDS